jgi:CrcB protein
VNLWVWLALAAVGAAGSVLRYVIDSLIGLRTRPTFPLGTLTVNLSGSLAFGFVAGLGLYHAFPSTPRLLLGTGVCGAYTTFSTFALESVQLAREGERINAAMNVGANLIGSCLAAAAGLVLASL